MSGRRRSRSRDKKIPVKLRMDTKPQTPRITDPSLPAGRRREIDNVMKKARAQTSPSAGAFWDKKLLEVEAKDPHRWRHSGYKSLYLDGSSSPSSGRRSRSRSPGRRSPRSPPPSSRRFASPPFASRRSLKSPPPQTARRSSPPPRPSPMPGGYRAMQSSRQPRPRSPPPPRQSTSRHAKRRSASASSISSCSDDSCSVCSPKAHRNARSRSRSHSPARARKPAAKGPGPAVKSRARPRPPSPSPPRRMPRPMTPPPARKPNKMAVSDRPTDPRRQPPPPRPRGSTGEVINVRGVKPPAKPGMGARKPDKAVAQPMLLKGIKKERTGPKRPGSPGGESSGSEDSNSSTATPIVATTNLSLSERFGKIAQWSADRERRDIENMRITKTGSNMKVMVEEDELLYGSPPRRYSLSPVPTGHFPDELLSSGQSRLAAWDDVRVRYQYYKDLGYLRDLSLEDYVKWEEWWYKYQEWLANERHYERWIGSSGHNGGSRRRGKKRLPATLRLN